MIYCCVVECVGVMVEMLFCCEDGSIDFVVSVVLIDVCVCWILLIWLLVNGGLINDVVGLGCMVCVVGVFYFIDVG